MSGLSGASRVELVLRLVVVDGARRVRSLSISAAQALVVGADPSADVFVAGIPAWGLVVPGVEGPCAQGCASAIVQVRPGGRGDPLTLAGGEGRVLQSADQLAVEMGAVRILAEVATVARPAPAPRFRAGLLHGHDPLFDGLVGIFGVAALVMSVAVARAERVVDLELPPEEIVAWLPIVTEPTPPVTVLQPPTPRRTAAGLAAAAPRPPVAPAARRGVGAVLRLLGTHGPSDTDWTRAIAENEELEQALSTVGGVESASLERDGLRAGGTGPAPTEASIGGIGLGGGGEAQVLAVEAAPGPSRRAHALAEVPPSADLSEALRAGLRLGAASVRACYERGLQSDPGLRGRLELTLVIGAGRVQEATVTGGDLQDASLTACVERAAMRWRFDASVSAPAVGVPFALSPG